MIMIIVVEEKIMIIMVNLVRMVKVRECWVYWVRFMIKDNIVVMLI